MWQPVEQPISAVVAGCCIGGVLEPPISSAMVLLLVDYCWLLQTTIGELEPMVLLLDY